MTRSKPTGELLSLIDNSSIKKRCEKVSQKKNYWLGTTAKSDEQHVAVIQHNKAKNARKSRAVLRSGILFGIRFFLGPNIKIRYSVLAKPNTEYNHS